MCKLYISMYHYTRCCKHSRYPNIKALDQELFIEQIKFMKNNFNIVTMEQVLDAVEEKKAIPENALLLTFDDGYIDNYTYALPILEKYDVQGSFFIPGKTFTTHKLLDVNKIHHILSKGNEKELVLDLQKKINYYRGNQYKIESNEVLWDKYAVATRFDNKEVIFIKRMLQSVLPELLRNKISSELFEKYVGITEMQLANELYMNIEQIRTLKRHGMFIGIHGYDHYWLGKIPQKQMENDISKALDTLEEFIDRKRWVMNFPYGNYNENVINCIKEKGACLGLTTEVGVNEIGVTNPFTMARLDCNDFWPKSNNYKKYERV